MIMKYFAQSVSYVLHPLLMPVYFLFFIFHGNTIFAFIPASVQYYCYLVTIFTLLVMPLVSLPVFRYYHLIRDYELEGKQERVYPILIAVGFAFLGFWLLRWESNTHIVQQLYLILIILLSLFSVITLRWKISMHMTAIGGLCGFLLSIGMHYPSELKGIFIGMILLSGVLGACRLYLKKHTPLQIYVGFAFGFGFVFGILS